MPDMPKLEERLREVMQAKGWDHSDVVRISGQSSSVVSQWLGASSKEIKRIARVGAAVRLAEASGYSAEWIAEGTGPRHRSAGHAAKGHSGHVAEAQAVYGETDYLDELALRLQLLPAEHREAAATNLAGWARDGGAAHWKPALRALLGQDGVSGKRAAAR